MDCGCKPYGGFDTGYSRNRAPSLGIPGIGVLHSSYGATGIGVLVNRRRRGYGADNGTKLSDVTDEQIEKEIQFKPGIGEGSKLKPGIGEGSKPSTGEVITSVAGNVADTIKALFGAQQQPAYDPTVVDTSKKPLPSWVGPAIAAGAVLALVGGAYALRPRK